MTIDKNIGFFVSDISYEEPAFMSENGSLVGLYGSYGLYGDYMLNFEASYAEGLMDYVGSGSSEAYDHIIELRELAGINYAQTNGSQLIPYIGLGYRYLNDDSTNTISTSGAMGYEREQSYLYSPIGIKYRNIIVSQAWEVNSLIEYDYLWQGTNHSHLGSVPGYDDITLNQFKGHGYRLCIELMRTHQGQKYIIEPFYKHWHVDTSDNSIDSNGISFVEPKNTSDELGIGFMWLFHSP